MIQDYYVQDYQGNNRMVVHQYMGSDFVGQTTHYYPFGGVIGDISTNQYLQDYKYSGKEFDRTYGLDFYDFHARQYDPKVPSFTSIDPKAEDYYGISPYAYCAGDPVDCVDPKGENVCVLIEPDGARGFGHMAILIQHDDQRWYLYSKNGTTEHSGVSGASDKGDQNGGKWKDSNKNLSYSSPEEFLKTQGERDDHAVYTEGYQIETIEGQDKLAIEAAQKEIEKDYNLLGSNCAKLVQNSLDTMDNNIGDPHSKLGQTPGSLIGGFAGSVLGIPTTGSIVGFLIEDKTPNLIYKRIKQRNNGTTIK
jgi:RHS repeat-associated protein